MQFSLSNLIKFYAKVIILLFIFSSSQILSISSSLNVNLNKNNKPSHHTKIKTKSLLNGIKGGGFGFKGICNKKPYLLEAKTMGIKNDVIKTFISNWVNPLFAQTAAAGQVCVGDFSGKQVANKPCGGKQDISDCGCGNFAVAPKQNFGLVAFNLNTCPCTEPASAAQMCFIFNYKTETYGVAFNGTILQCLLDLAGQVEGEAVTAMISNLALGFSLKGEFTSSVNIAYFNYDQKKLKGVTPISKKTKKNDIVEAKLKVSGQIFVAVTIGFPNFSIGGLDLSKYFQFNLTAQIFVNYGGNGNNYNKHSAAISNNSPKNHKNAKNFHKQHKSNCHAAVNSGAELTYTLDGQINISLSTMTDGFLPDMQLNLGKINFMIVGDNAPSGLNSGVYLYVHSNLVASLLKDVFQPILKDMFSFLGYPSKKQKVPGMNAIEKDLKKKLDELIKKIKPIKFSLFITEHSSGFKFQDGDWKFQCVMYKNPSTGKKKHRCQSGNKFINAIMNGVAWAAKEMTALFDDLKDGLEDVGHGVVDAAKDIGDGVVDAAKATKNAVEDAARATANAARATEQAAENAARATEHAAEKVARAVKKAAEKVKHDLDPFNWKK